MKRRRGLDLLFPPTCCVCREITLNEDGICDECREKVERINPPVCKTCGRNTERCSCKKSSRSKVPKAAPFYFEGVVRKAILSCKYYGQVDRSHGFACQVAHTVKQRYELMCLDGIVFVPMKIGDRMKRGINLSHRLAKEIGKQLDVPVLSVLKKVRKGTPQHETPGAKRRANVYGMFQVIKTQQIQNKNILVVDDVITTGSTLEEIGEVLRLAGASHVVSCAIGLTPSKTEGI